MKKNMVLVAIIGAIIGGTVMNNIHKPEIENNDKVMNDILAKIEEIKQEESSDTIHYVKDGYEYWVKDGSTVRVPTADAEPIHVVVEKPLFG